jgi:hypothetical protein
MSMDILPLGELRILFSRIGLVRGEDRQPEVTRIHPNLLFAAGPRRLGGRYTPIERPDMLYLASSERAANGRLVFRLSFQASSFSPKSYASVRRLAFRKPEHEVSLMANQRPSKHAVPKLAVNGHSLRFKYSATCAESFDRPPEAFTWRGLFITTGIMFSLRRP